MLSTANPGALGLCFLFFVFLLMRITAWSPGSLLRGIKRPAARFVLHASALVPVLEQQGPGNCCGGVACAPEALQHAALGCCAGRQERHLRRMTVIVVSHIDVRSFCFAASSSGSGGSLGSLYCAGLGGDGLGDFLLFFSLVFSFFTFSAGFVVFSALSSSVCSCLTLAEGLALPSLKGLPGPRLRCGLWP